MDSLGTDQVCTLYHNLVSDQVPVTSQGKTVFQMFSNLIPQSRFNRLQQSLHYQRFQKLTSVWSIEPRNCLRLCNRYLARTAGIGEELGLYIAEVHSEVGLEQQLLFG